MRISDWSSDVCSSDLFVLCQVRRRRIQALAQFRLLHARCKVASGAHGVVVASALADARRVGHVGELQVLDSRGDRAFTKGREHRVDRAGVLVVGGDVVKRSEEHTSELQSLMRISYAVFCLKKKKRAEHK